MDYPKESKVEQKVEKTRKQTLDEWVDDICKCKECRDGFVSFEVKGYETLFACPVCNRSERDLYPYQAIPSAKKWMGSYTVYTETQMFERKKERKEVAERMRNRAGRMPELDISTVGSDPF